MRNRAKPRSKSSVLLRRTVHLLIILALVVVAIVRGKNLEAPAAPLRPCPSVDVVSTIHFAANTHSRGGIAVVALGTITNKSNKPVHDILITWSIHYEDLSTSVPQTSLSPATVNPGSNESWGELATTNDGQVPPDGVSILKITGAPGNTQCQN